MPESIDPNPSTSPAGSTDAAPKDVTGSGGRQGSSQPVSSPRRIPGLPLDFYRGHVRARRAALLGAVLILGMLAVLIETHLVDPSALIGPHVARSEWAFTMTGARDLNAMGFTGRGITVCLVDSGIDMLHPDF